MGLKDAKMTSLADKLYSEETPEPAKEVKKENKKVEKKLTNKDKKDNES